MCLSISTEVYIHYTVASLYGSYTAFGDWCLSAFCFFEFEETMMGMRRWTWTTSASFFLVLVLVVSLGVGGSAASLRRSSSGSGLVLNPVGDDGGLGVGSGGGGEKNDTLALPLALVSQTRVAVLYDSHTLSFLLSIFFPPSSLPLSFSPYISLLPPMTDQTPFSIPISEPLPPLPLPHRPPTPTFTLSPAPVSPSPSPTTVTLSPKTLRSYA